MPQFYNIETSLPLTRLIEEIDAMQAKIDAQKPLREAIWATIQEKLRIEWTYDSNALEGSTLTKGETYFFLREGLTVEGKPLKDFDESHLDQKTLCAGNHQDRTKTRLFGKSGVGG